MFRPRRRQRRCWRRISAPRHGRQTLEPGTSCPPSDVRQVLGGAPCGALGGRHAAECRRTCWTGCRTAYPALDPNLPAGLSPTLIGQELRGRNGFTGVTITDALEAGALGAFGSTGQKAVTAAGAGMDLILCSARDVTQAEAATSALAAALDNGQLDPTAFNDAVNRVTTLRAGLF